LPPVLLLLLLGPELGGLVAVFTIHFPSWS